MFSRLSHITSNRCFSDIIRPIWFWGLLAFFVIFIVVTNIYLSVVATAEKSHRLIRLSAFFLAPFAFFVVAMYV